MSWFRKTYAMSLALLFLLASIPNAHAIPAFARKY